MARRRRSDGGGKCFAFEQDGFAPLKWRIGAPGGDPRKRGGQEKNARGAAARSRSVQMRSICRLNAEHLSLIAEHLPG